MGGNRRYAPIRRTPERGRMHLCPGRRRAPGQTVGTEKYKSLGPHRSHAAAKRIPASPSATVAAAGATRVLAMGIRTWNQVLACR